MTDINVTVLTSSSGTVIYSNIAFQLHLQFAKNTSLSFLAV